MKSLKQNSPIIMGVLNVTPDSFSDGGLYLKKTAAIARAIEMEAEGADIIDIGGESTRPGAKETSAEEEIARIVPVIEKLAGRIKCAISVDTRKARVAEAALKAGAAIANDISGLNYDKDMAAVIAKYGAGAILMHMKGAPEDMQTDPRYLDLIGEIKDSLKRSVEAAVRAGVSKENIAVDPGIGFGKTVEHNITILKRLGEFKELGFPICVGTSRKSFIGKITGGSGTGDRLAGTIATCVMAVCNGASILRVHDVKLVREAIKVTSKVLAE